MNLTYPSFDLWEYLQKTDKTVVMYGMGNGADKILRVLDAYGIEVADFFASDGFVRGHAFHGKTVLSYSAVKEKYGADRIIVLLSFATSLPSVMADIKEIADECELYAPDVPVCGDTLFCRSFAEEKREDLERAYALFADDESRRIFEEVLAYKLSGRIEHLLRAENDKDAVYRSLLHATGYCAAMDLGAYNGDTVRELLGYAEGLQTVYAIEPDRRNFRKLSEYAETLAGRVNIHTVQAAAWSHETRLSFGDEGNRNSGICASGKGVKTRDVPAISPDEVLDGRSVDYIKYDVEGAEREAIEGSRETILRYRPELLVSAYHRSEDLFALPLQIHEICPAYRLYLRRYPYIPAWDLNLICI